jgi:hypothetical protein
MHECLGILASIVLPLWQSGIAASSECRPDSQAVLAQLGGATAFNLGTPYVLEFELARTNATVTQLATGLLALSKLNWDFSARRLLRSGLCRRLLSVRRIGQSMLRPSKAAESRIGYAPGRIV